MVSRRQSLQIAGVAAATALAGCSSDVLGGDTSQQEHTLSVDRIRTEPVPWALYEPDESELFGDPARAALDAVLPDGRYQARGYVPVGEGNYVEHDGRYYRTETFVSGRATRTRPVVRLERVDDDSIPDDAVVLDSLDQPSARTVKILHTQATTGGHSGDELLRGDAYVMTRPAERQSRLVDDLDGRVVTMTENDNWAYRVDVSHEEVALAEHTVFAVEVADSPEAFREVVLASAVDADLTTVELPDDARDLLDRAIGRESYEQTGEPTEAFETLLRRLGFAVDEPETGRLLWDGESLFRASYYVTPED